MNQQAFLELKLTSALKHVLPWPVIAGAIGAWPMYLYEGYGWLGIKMLVAAFGIAFAVLFLSLAAVKIVAARSQAKGSTNVGFAISQAFTTARMINIILVTVLGLAAWYFFKLPLKPFFLWLIGFYLVMLFAETYWLTRVLKSLPSVKAKANPDTDARPSA